MYFTGGECYQPEKRSNRLNRNRLKSHGNFGASHLEVGKAVLLQHHADPHTCCSLVERRAGSNACDRQLLGGVGRNELNVRDHHSMRSEEVERHRRLAAVIGALLRKFSLSNNNPPLLFNLEGFILETHDFSFKLLALWLRRY
jgi:hypothetical protein